MRPNAGLESTPPRPRKQSDSADRQHLPSTTFFLTRDPDHRPTSATSPGLDQEVSPVRSLKETLEEADRSSKHTLPRYKQQEVSGSSRRRSTIRPQTQTYEGSEYDETTPLQLSSHQALSGTVTPSIPTSVEPSLPNSPKSVSSRAVSKLDDDLSQDETSSQAVVSSEEEPDDDVLPGMGDSAPQLVMPSIRMPSRRPFTHRGKQLGRFKLLVAGAKGSGKTSLIKSIVQLCEDIVHVDSVSSISKSSSRDRGNTASNISFMDEIHASTKPYPSWWSDLDESRVLRRRKSVGDAVLERNVCFVDTTNVGKVERVVQYLEQQFLSSLSAVNQVGKELTGLLSGRGGTQVDVVLYLISKDTLKEDCSAIQRLSHLCNVVTLVSKADLLSPEHLFELKNTDIPGIALPHLPLERRNGEECQASAPYSVSSANGSDFDNMDASLLMSPEYVLPLMCSELSLLVQQLFDPTTVAFLRHTSAKKLVEWYATDPRLTSLSSPSVHSTQPSTLHSPLPTSLSNSGVLIPLGSELSLNTSNSYALAKVADHTQREEHLAQIRLSKWASDLQSSLQRERERYEFVAQSERAIWLVQRMGEEVRDGQVLPVPSGQALIKANEKTRVLYSDLRYETHDPLGLLRWQDTVRTRGWAALQIIGSFGVVGGVALWLAKTWGFTTSLQEWTRDCFAQLFGTDD